MCNKNETRSLEINFFKFSKTGVDKLGELWATNNNIPVENFPAEWQKHGKSAGFIRNAEMAAIADALICIRSEVSSGSENMIQQMKKLKKPSFIKIV